MFALMVYAHHRLRNTKYICCGILSTDRSYIQSFVAFMYFLYSLKLLRRTRQLAAHRNAQLGSYKPAALEATKPREKAALYHVTSKENHKVHSDCNTGKLKTKTAGSCYRDR